MKVTHRSYGEQGDVKQDTTLDCLFDNEIFIGDNVVRHLENAGTMLANLSELLIKKGVITLEEVANDVLQIENYNPDFPTLTEIKD